MTNYYGVCPNCSEIIESHSKDYDCICGYPGIKLESGESIKQNAIAAANEFDTAETDMMTDMTKGDMVVRIIAQKTLLSALAIIILRTVDKYDDEDIDKAGKLLRPYLLD